MTTFKSYFITSGILKIMWILSIIISILVRIYWLPIPCIILGIFGEIIDGILLCTGYTVYQVSKKNINLPLLAQEEMDIKLSDRQRRIMEVSIISSLFIYMISFFVVIIVSIKIK